MDLIFTYEEIDKLIELYDKKPYKYSPEKFMVAAKKIAVITDIEAIILWQAFSTAEGKWNSVEYT